MAAMTGSPTDATRVVAAEEPRHEVEYGRLEHRAFRRVAVVLDERLLADLDNRPLERRIVAGEQAPVRDDDDTTADPPEQRSLVRPEREVLFDEEVRLRAGVPIRVERPLDHRRQLRAPFDQLVDVEGVCCTVEVGNRAGVQGTVELPDPTRERLAALLQFDDDVLPDARRRVGQRSVLASCESACRVDHAQRWPDPPGRHVVTSVSAIGWPHPSGA